MAGGTNKQKEEDCTLKSNHINDYIKYRWLNIIFFNCVGFCLMYLEVLLLVVETFVIVMTSWWIDSSL